MPTISDLAAELRRRRSGEQTLVVGLTGGVASGKTTMMGSLAEALRRPPDAARVEQISTDGFLLPNRDLEAAGILARKGYPETYDREALARAIADIRAGGAVVPGYSHDLYDVDPKLARRIERPDILLIEGLGLDRSIPLDVLLYLDADLADQESWYVARFLRFWEAARTDPSSFYARFSHLDRDGVASLASSVWRGVNLPNLEANIAPVRGQAHLIIKKSADHTIRWIGSPD